MQAAGVIEAERDVGRSQSRVTSIEPRVTTRRGADTEYLCKPRSRSSGHLERPWYEVVAPIAPLPLQALPVQQRVHVGREREEFPVPHGQQERLHHGQVLGQHLGLGDHQSMPGISSTRLPSPLLPRPSRYQES